MKAMLRDVFEQTGNKNQRDWDYVIRAKVEYGPVTCGRL